MKKLILLAIIISITLTIGCMARYQFPECNDKYAQASMISKIANKYEVCLQDVARNTTSVVLLGVLVDTDVATDAREAAENVVAALDTDIAGMAFAALVKDSFKAAILIELVELNTDYLDEFDVPLVIDKESRLLLQKYFVEDFIPRLRRYEQIPGLPG